MLELHVIQKNVLAGEEGDGEKQIPILAFYNLPLPFKASSES